jgi:hypothetical protein
MNLQFVAVSLHSLVNSSLAKFGAKDLELQITNNFKCRYFLEVGARRMDNTIEELKSNIGR